MWIHHVWNQWIYTWCIHIHRRDTSCNQIHRIRVYTIDQHRVSFCFRHLFYKCFQTFSKKDDETRCCWKFKNWSLHWMKKKFKQRFKKFYTFLLDNKKRIDRSCFKTILTTPNFSQINTLNFLSLKKLQEDHYENGQIPLFQNT